MKEKNDILDIQRVIKERIELRFHNQREGDGLKLYIVEASADMELTDEDIILIGLDRSRLTPKIGYSDAIGLSHFDWSNYYGKIKIYRCIKKKGMFGKESLKTIRTYEKIYNYDTAETEKISLQKVI